MFLWISFLILSIVAQVAGDFTVKEYSIDGRWSSAAITLILCTASSIFWVAYMRAHSSLAIGANIWSVATGVAALAIGVLMYHEPITTTQYIGMFLGMISLTLIL